MLRCVASSIAVCLLTVSSAAARIEPSFHLEQATWDATHIVLIAHGRIVESWKGDLTADDKPPVPLAAERGVLFLVKRQNDKGVVTWESAAGIGSGKERYAFPLKLSQITLRDGKALAIQQWKNPGPAELLPLGDEVGTAYTEATVKDEVLRITALQTELQTALKAEDLTVRGKILRRSMQSKCWYTWHEGFSALRDCGVAGAAQWCELLADDTLLVRHPDVLREMARFKTEETTAAVAELLTHELEFWKAHAADLPLGWRTGKGVPPHLFQEVQRHQMRLIAALEALPRLKSPASVKPVRELRDLWLSLPQLDGNKGPRQVSGLCERALP